MKKILFIALTFVLAACVTVSIDTPFDPKAGSYIHKTGKGKIEGSAFMRQAGGGVVKAAGEEVFLSPVTEYSRARMKAIYGDRKMVSISKTIENTPEEYYTQIRKIKADGDGKFNFENIHPGNYFIVTKLFWRVPGSYLPEGGAIYEEVIVKDGETARVVLNGS
jgi:hypothetical protein